MAANSAVPSLQVVETEITEVKLIVPRIHRDRRGFFSETYNKAGLAELGATLEFVQDNHSLSVERGVVRGLHFQIPPFAAVPFWPARYHKGPHSQSASKVSVLFQ